MGANPETNAVRSREDKRKALREITRSFFQTGLFFEWEALLERRGNSKGTPELMSAVTNAILDSTLIHLRALDDFFTPGKKLRDDDIRASDYNYTKDGRFLDQTAREAINKHLAHLSWARLSTGGGHFVVKHNLAAMDRMIPFMEFLLSDFLDKEDSYRATLDGQIRHVKSVRDRVNAKYRLSTHAL